MNIQPFTINIPDKELNELQRRLNYTRWPDEVEAACWDYAAKPAEMQELVAYWQTGFDWRAQEQAINSFAHFRAEIEGLGIHFIHERAQAPKPIPLILTHGWPSSFAEMLKLIP